MMTATKVSDPYGFFILEAFALAATFSLIGNQGCVSKSIERSQLADGYSRIVRFF
jgi:hypothetical protein